MDVVSVQTPELGNRSYLVHDGSVGVVIDVQRDLDRMLAEIERAGVDVVHVLETHIHNDYVTGGLDLARRTGAEYVVAAGEEVLFRRRPIANGEELVAGSMTVRAVHTPGHTRHHLAYVVSGEEGPEEVFTGGSMLFGTVGRTDLAGCDQTEELTRRQYRSARLLADELSEHVEIYPTHGFGSFCASAEGSLATNSTIGDERIANVALATCDEDEFVAMLLDGLPPYPRYYDYMAPLNRRGGATWDLQPLRALDVSDVRQRLAAGDWVVDIRRRTAFAQAHVAGSVGIEHVAQFATYFGWLLPWGAEAVLIGADPNELSAAQRDLARIGVDQLAGASTDSPDRLSGDEGPASYPTVDFSGLAAHGSDGIVVLDVRQRAEWDTGHLSGATHIPIQEVPTRLGELAVGQVWVHCASGYRASIAASLLEGAGRDVVLIDDHWKNAGKAGLSITS
ncbi:MAG: MBL fold metallo-hydrolase [Actinobacteria bacterium]|nr:MBL fold metallo-hydrolase [Actinomycetota bacterium]